MTQPAYKKEAQHLPDQQEAQLAEQSSRILDAYLQNNQVSPVRLELPDEAKTTVDIPPHALKLFVDLLTQMAEGNAVTLIPVHAELTTQEAADILNVSRPYLVQLLDQGEMPYRKVGTRRRIRADDVLRYKSAIEAKRRQALDDLAQYSQDQDMGYE